MHIQRGCKCNSNFWKVQCTGIAAKATLPVAAGVECWPSLIYRLLLIVLRQLLSVGGVYEGAGVCSSSSPWQALLLLPSSPDGAVVSHSLPITMSSSWCVPFFQTIPSWFSWQFDLCPSIWSSQFCPHIIHPWVDFCFIPEASGTFPPHCPESVLRLYKNVLRGKQGIIINIIIFPSSIPWFTPLQRAHPYSQFLILGNERPLPMRSNVSS